MNAVNPPSPTLFHKNLEQTEALLTQYFPLKTAVEHLEVQIGSIVMKAATTEGFVDLLMPRYQGFLGSDGASDFIVEAARASELDLLAYPNITVRSQPGGQIHYAFRWDFIAKIDLPRRYACILVAPVGTPLCLDSIFRIITAFVAVQKGGFLLHSAAIATPQGAYMFCGISGSGKSTIAKVSKADYDLLTDEMALIEKTADGYRVWGTPFWGELQLSVNRCAPLRAVFSLSKSKTNSIEEIPKAQAVTEFMKTILFFAQNLELGNVLMDKSFEFLAAVPFRQLNFLPEKSLWEVIHAYFG